MTEEMFMYHYMMAAKGNARSAYHLKIVIEQVDKLVKYLDSIKEVKEVKESNEKKS